MPDDYSADIHTGGSVAVGGSATGEIETAGDFDWFAVELVAGRTYVIDVEGDDTGAGTLGNTVLRGLYDAHGDLIADTRDKDGGIGKNAQLTFTATETETHYIEARGKRSQTGTYTVEVTDETPDLGDITGLTAAQSESLRLDGTVGRRDLPALHPERREGGRARASRARRRRRPRARGHRRQRASREPLRAAPPARR